MHLIISETFVNLFLKFCETLIVIVYRVLPDGGGCWFTTSNCVMEFLSRHCFSIDGHKLLRPPGLPKLQNML